MGKRLVAWLTLSIFLTPCACLADAPPVAPDTELVVVVHWRQIRNSPLVQAEKQALDQLHPLLDRLAGRHPAVAWLKRGGVDLVRDVDSLAVAMPRGNPRSGVATLRGTFDAARLRAAAADVPGVKTDSEAGAKTLELEFAGPPGCVIVVDDATLRVAANRKALDAARTAEAKNAAAKTAIGDLLKTIKPEHSLGVAATGPALAALLEKNWFTNAELAAQALDALDGAAATLTLAKDVQLQLFIHARDNAAAAKLTAALRSALRTAQVVARDQAKSDPRLGPLDEIGRTLRIDHEGSLIVLRGQATLDAIERLMKGIGEATTSDK